MLSLVIFVCLGIIISSFYGYWSHWFFHKPWSPWFFTRHLDHHRLQYPPTDFQSDSYRSSGWNDSAILFVAVFLPLCIVIAGAGFFTGNLDLSLYTLLGFGIYGLMSNYFHSQFHLNKTWMDRFKFFHDLRHIHYIHHLDVNHNHGIVFLIWDKLFKSYDDNDDFII